MLLMQLSHILLRTSMEKCAFATGSVVGGIEEVLVRFLAIVWLDGETHQGH